jgi:transcriptional regulator with XRE-family HTH domain
MLASLLRARRTELGRSLRAVARDARISPSYLGAIELGRNPATGRPPQPSLRVLGALARARDLELATLTAAAGAGAPPGEEGAHALLYVLQRRPAPVLEQVARLHAATTRRWVYVPDPREAPVGASDERVALRCRWPLGEDPYPDRTLDPARVLRALEGALRAGGEDIDAEVGLVIADCSAVMRWVRNPEAEIAFEAHWAEDAERVFRDALGRPPTANVCVYHHDDIEALAPQVDPLGVALALLRTHTDVAAVGLDGGLRTGAEAAREILASVRPAGVGTATWAELCSAAARGLVPR